MSDFKKYFVYSFIISKILVSKPKKEFKIKTTKPRPRSSKNDAISIKKTKNKNLNFRLLSNKFIILFI